MDNITILFNKAPYNLLKQLNKLKNKPSNINTVSKATEFARSYIYGHIIPDLIKKGYIMSERSGRNCYIKITDKGIRALATIEKMRLEVNMGKGK